jgi:hypothetical protein
MKTLDGTGAPLIDTALYYLQDTRTIVGNCGSWWRPDGNGYCCNITDAGQYTGHQVKSKRDTDVPWPVAYVLANTVTHVRVDTEAFHRFDDVKHQGPQ